MLRSNTYEWVLKYFFIHFQLLVTPKIEKEYMQPGENFEIDQGNSFAPKPVYDFQVLDNNGKPIGFFSKFASNYPEFDKLRKGLHAKKFFANFSMDALEAIRWYCHFGNLEDAKNAIIVEEIAKFVEKCHDDLLRKQVAIQMMRAYSGNVLSINDLLELAVTYKYDDVLWKVRGILTR